LTQYSYGSMCVNRWVLEWLKISLNKTCKSYTTYVSYLIEGSITHQSPAQVITSDSVPYVGGESKSMCPRWDSIGFRFRRRVRG